MGIDIPSYILGRGKGSGGGGGGGSGAAQKNINFIDYDGTILYSYTTTEFAALTAMPENPSHAGLTAQGWNWTLEKAKAHAAKYGNLWIGQMYITDDGKTRVYISLEEGRLEPYLGIAVNGTATIEWGDGTTSTVSGRSVEAVNSTKHVYPAPGEYVIAIDVTGSLGIVGGLSYGSQLLWKAATTSSSILNCNRVYQNAIQKVEIGRNTSIERGAFVACYSLTSITIPDGVTRIEEQAFHHCHSLTSITIPDGVTSIGSSAFVACYSLTSVAIPDSVTSIGSTAFQANSSLISITIPDGVTSIESNTFQYCYGLANITVPNSVESIGNSAFVSCYHLTSITIPDGVTNIANNAFQYCYSLTSITIPGNVPSIRSNVFQNCYRLASITISDGVESIWGSAFRDCHSLTSITIPDSVTSIGTYAFSGCYGLGFIRFEATTPPTVASSTAWTSVPTDCIIYVPSGTLAAYTSAANYPLSSSYTYVEY